MSGRYGVLIAGGLVGWLALGASAQDLPLPAEIGPTPIRFYSGNLSVGIFMNYWGTSPGGQASEVTPAMIEQLKRTSCTAMCDYPSWCCTEREEGQWDWSFYEANERILRENEIDYTVFCWLHFPPRWYEASERFVPYADLVTGATIPQLSLWSPDLGRIYDTYYGRLKERMGDRIAFIRLAMPSEYGEIGYCNGMTHWLRPQPNARQGYWCGDPHARESFRRGMLAKYGSLTASNRAWGTDFTTEDDIAPPDPETVTPRLGESAEARRYWLDFIDWYHEAWAVCLRDLTAIVRKHFPETEIIISLGYGSEKPMLGNDQARYIAVMHQLGLAAQTPGDIGFFATRRVSSACRHYGVPYFTEPPGDVPRDRQQNRIFMDLSNGTQTWFDYLPNLDQARDYFVEYKALLTGAPPVTDIAVWLSTADHWLHPELDWPKDALDLSETLRDAFDYEVIDDRMILDGALETLGIRRLLVLGTTWADPAVCSRIEQWNDQGGHLVIVGSPLLRDAHTGEERRSLPTSVAPVGEPTANADPEAADPSAAESPFLTETRGTGRYSVQTGRMHGVDDTVRALASLLGLAESEGGNPGRFHGDGRIDGVLTTHFAERVCFYNTRADASVRVRHGGETLDVLPRTIRTVIKTPAHAEDAPDSDR